MIDPIRIRRDQWRGCSSCAMQVRHVVRMDWIKEEDRRILLSGQGSIFSSASLYAAY